VIFLVISIAAYWHARARPFDEMLAWMAVAYSALSIASAAGTGALAIELSWIKLAVFVLSLYAASLAREAARLRRPPA
jgi:hypothetical protein